MMAEFEKLIKIFEDMEEAGSEFKLLFPNLEFDLVAIDEMPDNQ